jgi:hypothetical protein
MSVLGTHSFAKLPCQPREEGFDDTPNVVHLKEVALEPLLNIDEAARAIGRAHWTLRRDIKCGKLKCIRIGRRIMIEPCEIRRLIDEGREGCR